MVADVASRSRARTKSADVTVTFCSGGAYLMPWRSVNVQVKPSVELWGRALARSGTTVFPPSFGPFRL